MKRLFSTQSLYKQGGVYRSFASSSFPCFSTPVRDEISQPGCSSFPITDNDFGALPTDFARDADTDTFGYDERWGPILGVSLDPSYRNLWAQLSAPHQADTLQDGCFCVGQGVVKPTLSLGAPRFPRINTLPFFWIPRISPIQVTRLFQTFEVNLDIPFWGNEVGANVEINGGNVYTFHDSLIGHPDQSYSLGSGPLAVWVATEIDRSTRKINSVSWQTGATFPGTYAASSSDFTINTYIGNITAGSEWEQVWGGGHIHLGDVPPLAFPFSGTILVPTSPGPKSLFIQGGDIYSFYTKVTIADATYASGARYVWVEIEVDKTGPSLSASLQTGGSPPLFKSVDTSTDMTLNYLLGQQTASDEWIPAWGEGDIYIPNILHGATADTDLDVSQGWSSPDFTEYYIDGSFINGVLVTPPSAIAGPSSRIVFTASSCSSTP
jgi:hypothetical protein